MARTRLGLDLTAAYAFSRLPFRGQGLVFAVYLATMMIPLQVIIVPLFIEMRNVHLVDPFAGIHTPARRIEGVTPGALTALLAHVRRRAA